MSKKVFVQSELQKKFPEVKFQPEKGCIKAHFKDLNKFELKSIIGITNDYDVEFRLKRSGTGITVLVDVEED